ncbi:MAG: hypothetical protein QM820_52175 [Minicystis sp.]
MTLPEPSSLRRKMSPKKVPAQVSVGVPPPKAICPVKSPAT